MSDNDTKSKLSIINTVKELEARNYWNTVGNGFEYFPTKPRLNSVPTLNKQGRILQEPEDEWWINSEKHHFCFWTLIRDRSQPDGGMEPLLQPEIAELFGCSGTKIHFLLREAMDRLTSPENLQSLQMLLDLTGEEPGEDNIPFSAVTALNRLEDDDSTE